MPTAEEIRLWKELHIPEAMGRLREAYRAVYDDPYRANGTGFFKRYLNRFDHMVHAMAEAMTMVYAPRWAIDKREDVMPWYFFHQVNMHIFHAKHGETHADDCRAMVVLEKYLIQVHHFLDTQKFNRFTVYEHNEKRWWDYEFIEEDGVYSIVDEQLQEYDATHKVSILQQYRDGKRAGGWNDPEKHWNQWSLSIARRLMKMRKEARK